MRRSCRHFTKPTRSTRPIPRRPPSSRGGSPAATSSTRTTGEVLIDSGATITKAVAQVLADAGTLGKILVLKENRDPLILQSLQEDPTTDHESALLKIYQRLRPGNPPQLEKARELFHEKFFDTNRYRLGKVGRFRINRKFDQTIPEDRMTLDPEDYVNAIRYILNLRRNKGHIDDIDHLGNRRLRTIDELASDELRKGFLKLRRTVQERMSLKDAEDMTPRSLINPKSISAAIEYFFGRGELSQVVDQTNPLAQLTHERRLSAPGPGRAQPQAGRVRGARRAHLALRPHLPDRNARKGPTSG